MYILIGSRSGNASGGGKEFYNESSELSEGRYILELVTLLYLRALNPASFNFNEDD